MNKIEPTKITLEYYNKKISTEVDHSDVTLEELHEMFMEIVRAMGYHENTIKEFYE
jgi:KaiC/GvpD/RAD55 family RecA-like ATPase